MRIDDELVVALLNDVGYFLHCLAVNKNSTRNQRERNSATRRNDDSGSRISILPEDVNGNDVFRSKPVGVEEVVVVRNDGGFFRSLLVAIRLRVVGNVGSGW